MDQPPGEMRHRCPVCGAALQTGLAACAACGTPLAGMFSAPFVAAPATAAVAPSASAIMPDVAGASVMSAAASDAGDDPAASEADGWRCDWCGKTNPVGTDQCVHCGALYPRPETDAALTRVAEERMRAELATLNTMQRRRQRKGFGRLFSN